MIQINTILRTNELIALHEDLTKSEINRAIRRAINLSVRKTRVQMKKDIRSVYKIKASIINTKVLNERKATSSKLEGAVMADKGTLPLSLFEPRVVSGSVITRIRSGETRSKTAARRQKRQGVFVEIIKGKKEHLKTAFLLNKNFGVSIMARGIYKKAGFKFSKARMPITTMKSKSVFFATQNKSVSAKYVPFAESVYLNELERQLNGAIKY